MARRTFASRSLLVHVVRGAAGLGALVLGLWGFRIVGWPSLLLLPVSVWMFRGCPMCWTAGLFETLALRALRGKEPGALANSRSD